MNASQPVVRLITLRLTRVVGAEIAAMLAGYLAFGWICKQLAPWERLSGKPIHGHERQPPLALASPLLADDQFRLYGRGPIARLRIVLLDYALGQYWDAEIAPTIANESHTIGPWLVGAFAPVPSQPNQHLGEWTAEMLLDAGTGWPDARFQASFISPTSFAMRREVEGGGRRGIELLLPDPVRLLANLSTRWNALFPDHRFVPEICARLEQALVVTQIHHLATRLTVIPRNSNQTTMPIRGFVGDLEFQCLDDDLRSTVATLLQFGSLVGVGRRTSNGFGLFTVSSARRPRSPQLG